MPGISDNPDEERRQQDSDKKLEESRIKRGWNYFISGIITIFTLGGLIPFIWRAIFRGQTPIPDPDQEITRLRLAFPTKIDLKIGFFGASGVGITSLFQRQFNHRYQENNGPSSHINYRATSEIMQIEGGNEVGEVELHLSFIDERDKKDEQDKEKSENKKQKVSGAKACNGAVLTYDISNKASFDQLPELLKDIRQHLPKGVPILLLGCKSDLKAETRVSTEEAQAFAHKHKLMGALETSAKAGVNVAQAFKQIQQEATQYYASTIGACITPYPSGAEDNQTNEFRIPLSPVTTQALPSAQLRGKLAPIIDDGDDPPVPIEDPPEAPKEDLPTP